MLLCAKPFGKRVVYDREKSSEMTKYSVPSFGGHIDFSDDVTMYPVLVTTSYPGSSLFLPRESTLVSAGHVARLSKQLPTRVDSLFFKKRREKRMQIFSNSHEDRGMEVLSSLLFRDRDAEKSTVYYLRRFRTTNNANFPSTKYFTVGSICFEFAEGV